MPRKDKPKTIPSLICPFYMPESGALPRCDIKADVQNNEDYGSGSRIIHPKRSYCDGPWNRHYSCMMYKSQKRD